MRLHRLISLVSLLLLPAVPFVMLRGCGWMQCTMQDSLSMSFSMGGPMSGSPWVPLLQFGTNGFFAWRFEPVTWLLISSLFGAQGAVPYALVLLWSAGVGLALLVAGERAPGSVGEASAGRGWVLFDQHLPGALGAVFTGLMLLLFGLDTVLIGTTASFAWILVALRGMLRHDEPIHEDGLPSADGTKHDGATRESANLEGAKRHRARRHSAAVWWYATVIISLLSVFAANQLMLPAVLLAIAIVLCDLPPEQTSRARRTLGGAAAILLIPAWLTAMVSPLPQFPDYPDGAHVVPAWGVVDGLQPLLGVRPPLLSIDRTVVRSAGLVAASLGGVWLFFALCCSGLRRRLTERGAFIVLCALVLGITGDCVPNVHLSQIAPLQSISRLLPGMFPIPGLPLAIGISLFLTMVVARGGATVLIFLVLAGGISGAARIDGSGSPISFPLFAPSPGEGAGLARAMTRGEISPEVAAVLNSPSFAVVAKHGLAILAERESRSALVFRSPNELHPTLSAAENPQDLAKILDGRDGTRWSPAHGAQRGNEWFRLGFAEPERIKAFRLRSGRFFTDFPRGLSIAVSEECSDVSDGMDASDRYRIVYSEPATEGEIRFTSSGHPYYGEQYSSVLFFPEPITARCFLFRQTGHDNRFDWSVAELEIARQ